MSKVRENVVIIGMGYVGLPLACHLALAGHKVLGFDIDISKISKLKSQKNIDNILTDKEMNALSLIEFSSSISRLEADSVIFIVTVPTPINESRTPNMQPLLSASQLVGTVFGKNDIVVFESTVYPGATRGLCVPEIIKESKKRGISDIKFGYSPERVNPGDLDRTIEKIIKVVSGSDSETEERLKLLYGSFVEAGIFVASTVEEAEASKIIENIQRDVNIALMNELDMIFKKLNINTGNVIKAASTKWNFMNVTPGLVGGHCIGVDPYYMIHLAKKINSPPLLIEAARGVNETYLDFSLNEFYKWSIKHSIILAEENILFFGITFKPNCADIRNSKNHEALLLLRMLIAEIDVYDPWVKTKIVRKPTLIVIGANHDDKGEASTYFDDPNVKKYRLS